MQNAFMWVKANNTSPEHTMANVEHGGNSIMLWGCFSSEVTEMVARLYRKMDGDISRTRPVPTGGFDMLKGSFCSPASV